MEQTFGRDKAKKNIIIFVVGVFISILASIIPSIGELANLPWLTFIAFVGLIGFILEIYAIIRLRNVNKYYANSLWAVIFDIVASTVAITLSVAYTFNEGNTILPRLVNGFGIASDIFEALSVINFVLGTNVLAAESGKAMPKLTRIIVLGYVGIFAVSLVVNLLELIPAIAENATVLFVFAVIILVLYIIREIAYLFFLIRALWRVE